MMPKYVILCIEEATGNVDYVYGEYLDEKSMREDYRVLPNMSWYGNAIDDGYTYIMRELKEVK